MPLDPQIAAMLADAPAWPGVRNLSIPELRRMVRESSVAIPGPNVELASVADRTIAGPGGELPIRIYTPKGPGPFPVIVYFHGGGWVVGDLDTQDMIARAFATEVPALVISVDYRLAPEHPFPAAPDDAFAATRWAAEHAGELGGDPQRLAVLGDSAGGGLALGVALRARAAGGPQLCAQVNIYGSGNYPSQLTASAREFANGPILTQDDIAFFWSQYLADPERDQHDPIASPFRATSHAGLPPLYVATAECDPSRDDAEAYGAKVKAAGGEAVVKRYAGMVHGYASWVGFLPGAQETVRDISAFLRARFAAAEASAAADASA